MTVLKQPVAVPRPAGVPPVEQKTPESLPPWQKYVRALVARCYSNWEYDEFPPGLKGITVRFLIQPDGTFTNITLPRPSGIDQLDFSAIEAISESSGFQKDVPPIVKDVEIKLSKAQKIINFNCAKRLKQCYPNAPADSLVFHLIPIDALSVVPKLKADDVHSLENLRLIKAKYKDSPETLAIREEWVNFLRSKKKLTINELREEAQHIEKQHPGIFEDLSSRTED